jgi:hypothetical protein
MMKTALWVALLVALQCPNAARADMGTPGFKQLELRVVIDNLDDYAEYQFFMVGPSWQPSTKDGPAPSLVTAEGWRLYVAGPSAVWKLIAVPRQRAEPVDWEALAPKVLSSNTVECPRRDSVPGVWPFDYEVRHYRIGLVDGQLSLALVSVEQRSHGFSSWLPAIFTTVAITGVGLWIVRRRRRARASGA